MKSDFKIALRNIDRHKVISLVNILGLAIGLGVCLLMTVYAVNETRYEDFQANGGRIYRISLEWGRDEAGLFHKVPRIDDSRPAEFFSREVLADFVRKGLLSPEWAERLLSRRHTGFSVHSRVRAKTKTEAERVDKYMIRPLLSLERLSFDERTGRVGYRYGEEPRPLLCPQCSGQMKVIAFLTDYAVVDRIIDHLKLTFVAERPPPPHVAYQEILIAAEAGGEYSSQKHFPRIAFGFWVILRRKTGSGEAVTASS